jgi:hypothetical protein
MTAMWSLLLLGCVSPPEEAPGTTQEAPPTPAPPIPWPESNIVVHGEDSCTWQGIDVRVAPPDRVGCHPKIVTASFEQATNAEGWAWAANLLEAQGFTLVARPRDHRGRVQEPYYERGDMGVAVGLYAGNAADGGPLQVLLEWHYKGERPRSGD